VDFLFVLIELFSLGVTALRRYERRWKLVFLKEVGQFQPNFHELADVSREPFLHGWIGQWMITTLSLTMFTQRNFVADFFQVTCNFTRRTTFYVFEPPPSGAPALWGFPPEGGGSKTYGQRTMFIFGSFESA